jgi:signal transduction histidine kinase/CheY-like chemotaxis protein
MPGRALILLLLAVITASARGNETGLPLLRNITSRDYHEDSQMWAGIQTPDGIMYFGNLGCVVSYDSATWTTLKVPDTTFVRGLAQSPEGVIYVGAYNQLGWFRETPAGKQFVSLLDQVPPEARDFRDIWAVVATTDGICFIATRHVLRWRDGKLTDYPTASHAFDAGGQVYQVRPGELQRLDAGGFVTVARDPFFGRVRIATMRDETDGSILISTLNDGLYKCSQGRVAPYPTGIDSVLRSEGLREFRRLSDGGLALATSSTGVIFLDRENRFVTRVDAHTGLGSSFARAMTMDREGGLWLSHTSGLTRVEWPAAVTIFNELNGLDRSHITAIARHDGILYLATSDGLYGLSHARDATQTPRFAPILREDTAQAGRPLSGLCMDLLDTPDGLISAGPDGVYLVHGYGARRVFKTSRYVLTLAAAQNDPTRIYVSTDDVRRVRIAAGGWRDDGLIPGLSGEVRSAIGAADGSLWVSITGEGFFHVHAPENDAAPRIDHFPGGSHGLPRKLTALAYVQRWRDRPFFITDDGCFQYDDDLRQFARPTLFGSRLAAPFELAAAGSAAPDHLWLRTFTGPVDAAPWHERRIYRVSAGNRWQPLSYAVADLVDYSRSYLEEGAGEDAVLWLTGSDLLVRVTLRDAFKARTIARPLLRAAGLQDGARRSYRQNTVTFDFPAPAFRQLALPQYQSRLRGFEDAPAPWSSSPMRTFTNLPAGAYTFEVRARESNGVLSEPATLSFSVLPPWWRTAWAWTGYGCVAFFMMAGLIRWRVRALRHRNAQLEQLVAANTAELRDNAQDLRHARDEAESANRAKTLFLANMSHELRTPLNTVLGYARMLRDDNSLSDLNRQRIGVIDHSGTHLLQVINDVLDLSKIEAGKLTLSPAPFDLPHLLDTVARTFTTLAQAKALAFNAEFDPALPGAIVADEQHLRQVFFNLLGNALKFTERGAITFSAHHRAGTLRFMVADTGIGIAPDELAAIFLPFHQARAHSRSGQGTGLGLTISQRIVELMGGRIQVESHPGRGSRFWFEISPRLATLTPGKRPRPVTGYAGARRQLLVVDDDADNRNVLRDQLEPLGFIIHEAADGESCLARLASLQPDAVLLDLRMPGMGGLATASRIRELAGRAKPPLIAISASVFEADHDKALAAGCHAFLPKPVQLEHLLEILRDCLHLDWIHRIDSAAPFTFEKPGAALLAELYELSQAGDVDLLRSRLAELEKTNPRLRDFLRALDGLAARYQMKRIRELLQAAKTTTA